MSAAAARRGSKMHARSGLWVALLVVIAAPLAFWLGLAWDQLRPFHEPAPHGPADCKRVGAMPGPEDIEVDPTTGIAWIASADRRGGTGFRPRDGAVYTYRPGGTPARVPVEGGPDLRLHGLSLWVPPAGGEKRLFLVQHGEAGDSVEILRIDERDGVGAPRLVHLRTVREPLFISLNDVAAAGPDSFYATNDHGSRPGGGHVFEDFAMRARSSVVYFDGAAARTVVSELRYGNGVQLDRAHPLVYVAETTGHDVRIYSRRADGALGLVATHDVDTAPDNFSIGPDGALYVACHPSTFAFMRHARRAERRSPSQVLRLRVADNGVLEARDEVYLDGGDPISGSSVAAIVDGRLLVGGVFDPFLLDCAAP